MCYFSAAFPTERHPRLDECLPGDLDVSGEHDGEAGGVGAGHRVLVDGDQLHGVARRAALLEGRVPVLVVEGGSRGAGVVTANAQMLEGRNFPKTLQLSICQIDIKHLYLCLLCVIHHPGRYTSICRGHYLDQLINFTIIFQPI